MLSSRKGGEGPPRRNGEIDGESRRCRGECLSVRARVGKDQQDVLESAVSQLQHHPSQLTLAIDQPRVRLDWQVARHAAQSIDESIPRALIARNGQWYLGTKPEIRVQSLAQSSEEGDLPCFEHGIRPRIGADPYVQPDRGTDSGELID